MLANVLRFLLLLLLVRIVLRALARLFRPSPAARRAGPAPGPAKPAEDLVLDRVCRTHVPRSRALLASVGGHEEHFCSPGCRDKAQAAVLRAS